MRNLQAEKNCVAKIHIGDGACPMRATMNTDGQ